MPSAGKALPVASASRGRVGRSDQHNRRAAWTAREKGLTCPDCGSSEPVPEGEAQEHLHGGMF